MKQTYQMNGYKLHIIKTKKFKNITISLRLQNHLTKETSTIRTLLTFVLIASTNRYKTTKELAAYLDEMYGARLSNNILSKGKSHIMQLYSGCVNENYLPERESLLKKQIKLINDLFYNPNVLNGAFDEKIVELKKKELKERLQVAKDDKFSYSLDKLFEYMGRGSVLGVNSTGYEDEIDSISSKDLFDYLQKCILEDEKHLYVVGDVEDSVVDLFKESLKFEDHSYQYESVYTFKSDKKEVLEVCETQDITQAKLNMGFTIDCNYISDDHYAFTVFNAYYGGFSQSRLFQKVREENSLCYYVSSSYDAFNGIMIVNSGIEDKDYEKTKSLILEELDNIKDGQIEEERLELAKGMLANSLRKSNDEAGSIISIDYNRDITGKTETNDEYLEKIMSVSKEDVIKVANKVKLDTIYLLTRKGKVCKE